MISLKTNLERKPISIEDSITKSYTGEKGGDKELTEDCIFCFIVIDLKQINGQI
jgi:hypothetical protein